MANPKGKNKNGYALSYTYMSYAGMRTRIRQAKQGIRPAYTNVKICEKWMTFEGFLEDMGERPEGTSLDRINPYGDYCKENCRWADKYVQQRNRTNNRKHIVNGVVMCEKEIALMIGISQGCLWKQLHTKHRSIQEILERHGIIATVEET